MTTHNLDRVYYAKKNNVRIEVLIYKSEADATSSIVLNTRRLHSFKERKISESSVVFSIDTLRGIHSILTHLFNSSYCKKHLDWQNAKEKFKIETDVK